MFQYEAYNTKADNCVSKLFANKNNYFIMNNQTPH